MQISRSIFIEAPLTKVKSVVTDFHSWPIWSPWLITEPDAKVVVADDGQSYTWEGKRVGAGEMSIKAESNEQVDYNLLFLKPWKSKADVSFLLQAKDNGTEVSWTMQSSLPFFLFFMKKKTEAWIGSDYERGLAMLKEYIEQDQVNSKLEFMGSQPFTGTYYVGIERKTTYEGMKQSMGQDFGSLMEKFEMGNGQWFSIYHKFDMVHQKVHYTACVGLDELPDAVPLDWVKGKIEPCNMFVVRHIGPYDHIGNAWSAAMSCMRAKEFKTKRKTSPLEIYRNSPQNTDPKDLVSDICFIEKG